MLEEGSGAGGRTKDTQCEQYTACTVLYCTLPLPLHQSMPVTVPAAAYSILISCQTTSQAHNLQLTLSVGQAQVL